VEYFWKFSILSGLDLICRKKNKQVLLKPEYFIKKDTIK